MTRHAIRVKPERFELKKVKMTRVEGDKPRYESMLAANQLEMLRVQQAYHHQQLRAVLVFEGWDAGGKGGSIRRLTEKLDPRGFQVHAIGAPTAEEQGRHYLYRFWARLPLPGKLALFDRSWYGRVLVERVEGFARKDEWRRAYTEINDFEKKLADDGVRILKFFLHITPEEQLKRFAERLKNPYKRWKLTAEDLRNREKWGEYTSAVEEMLERTTTPEAPWVVVPANHKWTARLTVLNETVRFLSQGIDVGVPELAPDVAAAAGRLLGLHPDGSSLDGEKPKKDKKGKKGHEDGKPKKGKKHKDAKEQEHKQGGKDEDAKRAEPSGDASEPAG